MVFYNILWRWPQVYNEFKKYEQNFEIKNIQGHEIHVQNQIQPCAFEYHF